MREAPGDVHDIKSALVYKGDGTDMSDSSYSVIWNNFLEWSGNNNEMALLNGLIVSDTATKKKPLMNGILYNPVTREEYNCDLIWQKEKLVFLTAENEDLKEDIIAGGWICLCGADSDLTVEGFIDMIPEA